MNDTTPNVCPVCENLVDTLNTKHPGYVWGTFFEIAECPFCDAQYAYPRIIADDLYETIYAHAHEIPGYARYLYYRNNVSSAADALELLASKEGMYWFVIDYLREHDLERHLNILEIGSGLGYLTYSLHRNGWSVQGIDISTKACTEARSHFGPLFRDIDALDFAKSHPSTFDIVVMTEVIEHLPDVYPILDAIWTLLEPGGVALITTPNKSYHPPLSYWMTDGPPVHLSWFSEKSIERIAARSKFELTLHDFTRFNLKDLRNESAYLKKRVIPARRHEFEEDGSIRAESRAAATETLIHGNHLRAMRATQPQEPITRKIRARLGAMTRCFFGEHRDEVGTSRDLGSPLQRGERGDTWRSRVIGGIFHKRDE